MKNIVKLTFKDKVYESHNEVHPQFLLQLVNLIYRGHIDDYNNATSMLSVASQYSISGKIPELSGLTASNNVGIYAFKQSDTALKFYGDPRNIPSLTADYITTPMSTLYLDSVPSYSVSSINNNSIIISQIFKHTPTGNAVHASYKLGSFSIKTRYVAPSVYTVTYSPLAYITTKKLTGKDFIELYPTEFIKLDWILDFNVADDNNNSMNIKGTVNGVSAPAHPIFLTTLTKILLNAVYLYPETGSNDAYSFKITGIIAFKNPNDALFNSGSTALGNAFYLTPDADFGGISANTNDLTVTYSVSYTNNTGLPQQIGSIMLSGNRVSEVKSVVPISWINSKHLWGQEVRVINPSERIELTWTMNLAQSVIDSKIISQV